MGNTITSGTWLDTYRKYAVEAGSLEEFLVKYYRHDRFQGRGEEYAAAIRKSAAEDVAKWGGAAIGPNESVTGEPVGWFPGVTP